MKNHFALIASLAAAVMLLSGCTPRFSFSRNVTVNQSLDDLFASRRSVRSYDATTTISEEEVRTLLTAWVARLEPPCPRGHRPGERGDRPVQV